MQKQEKILIVDIETLPMLVYSWDLWNPNSPEGIKEHPSILCIQYKWLHERDVKIISVLNTLIELDIETLKPKKTNIHPSVRNDKYLLVEFAKILKEADMIVTKNGTKFDMKWLNGRNMVHNLKPFPDPLHFDIELKLKAKSKYASRKLGYVAKLFGIANKSKTEYQWWLDACDGKIDAIKKIIKYGKQDIVVTEALFKRIRAHFPSLLNKALYGDLVCPSCGGDKFQSNGLRRTATALYRRLCCTLCGHWFKSSFKLNEKVKHK